MCLSIITAAQTSPDDEMILVILSIGAVVCGVLALVWFLHYNSPVERAKRRKKAEQQRWLTQQRNLNYEETAAQRQASCEGQRQRWLERVACDIRRVQTEQAPRQAMRAGNQLALLIRGLIEVGSVAFDEAEFRKNIRIMWQALQCPTFGNFPTLHSHLETAFQGYVRGWEITGQSGCSVPQFIGLGSDFKGIIKGAVIAYGLQTIANRLAGTITNHQLQRGLFEMAAAADVYAALLRYLQRTDPRLVEVFVLGVDSARAEN